MTCATFRVDDCDVTLHDAHDALLYKRFYDAHIVTRHASRCDVYNDYIVARIAYDDDDNVTRHDVTHAYDDDAIVIMLNDQIAFA